MPDPRTATNPTTGGNPPAMPKIIVQFGGEEWAVDLREGVNVAGRSPQAAIPIRDASMSREHCEIVLEAGIATVVDRGSMNGTLVNGTKMDRKVLAPGDKIQIGKAALFFEEKQARSAPAKAAPAAGTPVVGMDDFSVWRRVSGGGLRIVIVLALLALVGAGAVVAFNKFGQGATVKADPSNLLGTTGWFDPGPENAVVGWSVKRGLASRIQIAEGAAKQGKTCLQLEKSGANQDLVAEVACQESLVVPSGSSLEISAWVRSESSGILPALKVSWMASRTGPVLLEDMSEPAPGASDWTQMKRSFAPPPGATHGQLSLVAVGRAGRVLFDDIRATHGSGSGLTGASMSGYSIVATEAGVLNVAQETRRIMNNVQVYLASDKEGTIPQAAATAGRVQVDAATKKLTATGKIPSPVDLRPVELEFEASGGKDSLLLGYRLRGDSVKQVDRLGLTMLIPGDLKGDYSNPVSRLWFRTGSGDFGLEISDGLMRVSSEYAAGGGQRVHLNVTIPKGASEMAFGFHLKSGGGGSLDPMAEVDKAVTEERMSDALELLGDLLAATREDQKRQQIQARIAALREAESTDWQAVQAQRFVAELVGLKPYFETANQKLGQYEKRWPRGKRADACKAERERLASGLAAAAEDRETLRAHRLIDRAEEHAKEGRKQLARELCDAVRRHYAQSGSATVRVAELLKKLGSE